MLFTCAACGGTEPPGDGDQDGGQDVEKDMTLAENYDFGSPESWAGEKLVKANLGDAVFDVYPEDHFYDWGQSILWDSQDKIYKMWWCRQSRYDSIWYAESNDLKHWHSLQKVLVIEPGKDTTWLKLHVGKPSVLKVKQGEKYEYRMYFESPATIKRGGAIEYNNNVFLATSDNGKAWNIWSDGGDEPYPIIRMTDEQIAASNRQSEERGDDYGYYGFGQPSVTQKDGVFYLYYTHSLVTDAMYVAKSTDGIHFTDHKQVFTRASSGVKYNTLTKKFMFTWALNNRVRYMESDDGYNFEYSNVNDAEDAETLSIGVTSVRGYPDFVCDENAQVTDYTCYVAYMEGVDPGNGQDFRLRADTWDIHMQAFNVKEFANRTMVLPNGRIRNNDTKKLYDNKEFRYEAKTENLPVAESEKTLNGKRDSFYEGAAELKIDRASYYDFAVPGKISATVYAKYTSENLYLFVSVDDPGADGDDSVTLLIDEKRFAENAAEITNVTFRRSDGAAKFTDGDGAALIGESRFTERENGYDLEVKLPWRYKTTQTAGDSIGFDCFVYNRSDSEEFKSKICYNDCMHHTYQHDIHNAGTLVFSRESI